MKAVKTSAEYTIFQKRNKRYCVKNASKKTVNGEDKVKILLAEGLIKVTAPSAPAEPEATPAEESAEGSSEEAAEK